MSDDDSKTILRLTGANGTGPPVVEDLIDLLEGFRRLVRNTVKTVSDGQVDSVEFLIRDLVYQSATLEVETVPIGAAAADPRTKMLVAAGVRLAEKSFGAVQRGERLDPRLDRGAIRALRRMSKPVDRRNAQVVVGREVTSATDARTNLSRMLKLSGRALGSLKGRLEAINLHNGNGFAIYPPIGRAVACTFEDSLYDKVYASLKRVVTVTGLCEYVPASPLPHRIKVENIAVHEEPRADESFRLARGIAGPSKIDSVTTVRRLRDGWE